MGHPHMGPAQIVNFRYTSFATLSQTLMKFQYFGCSLCPFQIDNIFLCKDFHNCFPILNKPIPFEIIIKKDQPKYSYFI